MLKRSTVTTPNPYQLLAELTEAQEKRNKRLLKKFKRDNKANAASISAKGVNSPSVVSVSSSANAFSNFDNNTMVTSTVSAALIKSVVQEGIQVMFHPDSIAPGAKSACGTLEVWCQDWWAQVQNATDGSLIQQLSGTVDVSAVDSQKVSAATEKALRDCAMKHLPDAIVAAYQSVASGIVQACPISPNIYSYAQLMVNIKEQVAQSICASLQAEIQALEQNSCDSLYNLWEQNKKIILGVCVPIAVLGITGTILYCNRKKPWVKGIENCMWACLEKICCCFKSNEEQSPAVTTDANCQSYSTFR